MNRIKIILLISIIVMGLGSIKAQAQRKEKTSDEAKTEMQERANLVIVKAEERAHGKYGITIDAGLTKDGKAKVIYRNKKEKKLLEDIISSASIVSVLEILSRVGYKIDQAYAVNNGDITVHYYILKYQDREFNDIDYKQKRKARSNQNRAQMSPEEIEKRKKMRENKR